MATSSSANVVTDACRARAWPMLAPLDTPGAKAVVPAAEALRDASERAGDRSLPRGISVPGRLLCVLHAGEGPLVDPFQQAAMIQYHVCPGLGLRLLAPRLLLPGLQRSAGEQ